MSLKYGIPAAVLLVSVLSTVLTPGGVLRVTVQLLDALNQEPHIVVLSRNGERIALLRHKRTGMVHVNASNEVDLCFGSGYAQARDRLFQLEIMRRLALGTLSEVVGPAAVLSDRWNRAMNFRDIASHDWEELEVAHPEAAMCLTAFVDGMNTYLDARGGLLGMPIDLMLLQTVPERFKVTDCYVFARWHAAALNKGWQNEELFARAYADLDDGIVELLRGILRYDSETPGAGMGSMLHRSPEVEKMSAASSFDGLYANSGGSNAWVIHGNYTATNKPILANDPHLPFTQPAMWIMMRQTYPGFDGSGFCVPFVPFIIAGHNKHLSYGITLGRADVDDLFLENVELVDAADRKRDSALSAARSKYLDSDGRWKPVHERVETIRIKGQPSRTFVIQSTRRGPFVCDILGYKETCSLAALALQPSSTTNGTMASFRQLALSRNWHDFVDGLSLIGAYQLSFVYADYDGNIGYHMTGAIPEKVNIGEGLREGWNPDHQWSGFHPFHKNPHSLNPASGFIISANHKPHQSQYDDMWLGDIWQHGWRNKRIEELIRGAIRSGNKIDTDMVASWQRDVVSIPGRSVASFVNDRRQSLIDDEQDNRMSRAFQYLADWDGSMDKDLAAPAIYAAFKEAFLSRVFERALANTTVTVDELLGLGMPPIGKLANDLEGRHGAALLRFLEEEESSKPLLNETLESAVKQSMQRACARLSAATGSISPHTWTWGSLHTAAVVHPLGKGGFPLNAIFDLDLGGVPGDVDTVCLAAYLHQSQSVPGLPLPDPAFKQRGFAASTRMIVDFGRPHEMLAALCPGNSGRLSSPYYRNMKDLLTGKVSEGIWLISMPQESIDSSFYLETTLADNKRPAHQQHSVATAVP
ncbi:hypothetical protein DIPPA_64055 [Diplonema papillatum]|nr:hypothetical protein DIPPA_64055 [Diplonema papillatum]